MDINQNTIISFHLSCAAESRNVGSRIKKIAGEDNGTHEYLPANPVLSIGPSGFFKELFRRRNGQICNSGLLLAFVQRARENTMKMKKTTFIRILSCGSDKRNELIDLLAH